MDDIFVGTYRSKSTDELTEIANSAKYHDGARKAAVTVLSERGEFDKTAVEISDYPKQGLDELLAGLANYKIEYSKTPNSLTIFKDEWNGVTGTILFCIGACLVFVFGFLKYQGNTYWGLMYLLYGGLIASYFGWHRIGHSKYFYLKIEPKLLTLKKGGHLTKKITEIDKTDFTGFSVREYLNSISIFLNSATNKPLSISNLPKKDYEPTKAYAEQLADELTQYFEKLGNTTL